MPLINFSGIASGIDTAGLIQATLDAARAQKVAPKEKKVTELEETNSTLNELKAKLTALQSQIRASFSTLSGGGVKKTTSSTDETVVSASATNAATNGTYALTVSQLAKNHTFSFDDRFASASTPLKSTINDGAPAADRTISFTTGQGGEAETINVVVTSTMTISEFASQYNTTATKSVASVVNVGTAASPSYALTIVSLSEGTEKGLIAVPPTVGSEFGDPPAAPARFQPPYTGDSPATNAEFALSGVSGTITRPSNTVNDVIPGVAFTLSGTSVTPITVTVKDDKASTLSAVKDFVDAYNEMVKFIDENDQIQRQENGEKVENIFGPLANTRVDDNFLTSIRSALSSSNFPSGTAVRIFADLGITTERDGTLKLNEQTFETALQNESNSVNGVLKKFADTVSLTGGTIDQYIRFGGLFDVTVNGNKDQIRSLNEQITQAEASLAKQEESMRARFARLESLIGGMQQQQQALSSALAGLAGNSGR